MNLEYIGPEGWGDTAYAGDAGIDIPITTEQILEPGEFYDLPSGIRVAIPEGYYGRIAARSGALRKRRIRVYEGVIDAGFRGELFTFVEAVGPTATAVQPGDRLAQLIIQPVVRPPIVRVEQLTQTERGTKGFGSSDHLPTRAAAAPRMGPRFGTDGTFDPLPWIYFGGPLDFKDHTERDRLIGTILDRFVHRLHWYDPLSANLDQADPKTIWDNNDTAIRKSDIGVFLVPHPAEGYGFGSPIEIVQMLGLGKRVIVYHGNDNVGIYLRKLWQHDGLIIPTDWRDFMRVLDEEITKAANG